MKTQCWILIVQGLLTVNSSVHGNVVFSQDFSTNPNGPVSSYVSATPDGTKWNAVTGSGSGTSVGVANGTLNLIRGSSGTASYSRTSDFNPAPDGVIFKFDLGLSSTTVRATTAAAVWQIGAGFSESNRLEDNANVHSQFALNLYDTHGGFKFQDLKTGTESTGYSGKFPITWVVNNSNGPLPYDAPNGTTRSVAADHWDLWCGSFPIFSGSDALSTGQPLTDLKFGFVAGSGTITMDNFSIQTLPAVPEPAATGTATAGFLVAVALITKYRRHSSVSRQTS